MGALLFTLDPSIIYFSYIFRVEEYVNQGKDSFLVDPDPDLLYKKRKLTRQSDSVDSNIPTSSGPTVSYDNNVSFPQHGWGIRLEKMPLFTKAEMNRFIANTGKRLGSSNHSVPTSWKKGKTFLEDEYLNFFFRCKCHHSFRKNDSPHVLRLAMCIVSGEVVQSTCSCVAGKTGYCNHALALML